jgi:hypothetical protein
VLACLQALRLFVHYPFIVRAVQYCRSQHGDLSAAGSRDTGCLEAEALKTCLRGQTFFSLGLRFMYLFIPLVRRNPGASKSWPPWSVMVQAKQPCNTQLH